MGNRERELFEYKDNHLYWKMRPSNRCDTSKPAGTINTYGYLSVSYDGKRRMLHRVVWDYFNDSCEGFVVDHINRDFTDNRIENLRLATRPQNARNSFAHRDNKVGLKGVHKHGDRFRAQARINGKRFHLGLFNTAEEAHEAYCNAFEDDEFFYGGYDRKV